MNPNNHHDRDDARLAELLRTVEPDTPPDTERLSKLRDLSVDTFVGRALLPVSALPANPDGQECPSYGSQRSTPMTTLALRGLAAALASAAIILVSAQFHRLRPCHRRRRSDEKEQNG